MIFKTKCRFTVSRRTPSESALNERGFTRIRINPATCRYILETVQNGCDMARGYCGTLIGSHRYPIDMSDDLE